MILKTMRTLGFSIACISLTFNAVAIAATKNPSKEKFRPAPQGKAIENQYIVILKSDYVNEGVITELNAAGKQLTSNNKRKKRQQKIADISIEIGKKHNADIRHKYHSKLSGFAVTMDALQLEEILKDERVDYIEQDTIVSIDAIQEDVTWGIDRIDQENLPLDDQYFYKYTGDGVTAYIVDTGIQSTHSEFGNRVGTGVDYVGDGYGTEDCQGHGTHVAGTVGGSTYGVAKEVNLIPVRVLGCSGSAATSDVIASLAWILENASLPAVVNMSLGTSISPTSSYITALTELVDAGIPVVVSAGNSPSLDSCERSPSGIAAAITVAATDFATSDMQSEFSSYGECVDIFAPGDTITSASIEGGFTQKSGTSMSAPHVTGVIALYLEDNPNADRYDVEAAIEANAVADLILDVEGTPNLLVQTGFLSSSSLSTSLNIENVTDWGGSDAYTAANTIDGSLDWASRWEASGSPVHLVFDLGSVQQITEVGISWGWGTDITYSFEIWARASTTDSWTKVREKGDSTGTTSSIESYDISNIDAQYVRIKTHENSNATDITVIKEVEIYGGSDDATIARAFDDGSSNTSYPASNAIDTSTDWTTRWAAYDEDETGVNLTIELEETTYVTHVPIAFGRGDQYIYTFEIYARADTSGEWTKVFDDVSNGATDDFEVFDITDINARQIRIKSFGSTDNTGWTNINEVMIYGAVKSE